MKFKPLKNRILATQIKEKKVNKTASGLFLGNDEEVEVITNDLNIVRVGKDVEEVKENDKVLFDGKGTLLTLFDQTYVLTTEANVIGVYE